MKTLLGSIVLCAALAADAGMNIYVGRKVSADGTTIIGRAVDAEPSDGSMRTVRFERGERNYADCTANGYAFTCTCKSSCLGAGLCCDGAINEKGVMLLGPIGAETKEVASKVDVFVSYADGGYGARNLPDYLIGKAATAREAVEMLGKVIAEHGSVEPAIYTVADTNEAWHIEVYTGRQWAAVQMPEDKVAGFGNAFGIRDFCTNETERVMYSPNLVKLAVDNDFVSWVDEEGGCIDLMATYSRPLWDNPNYQSYLIHRAWAPNEYSEEYAPDTYYPLFFTPEHLVSVTDVFELMRDADQQNCRVLQMRHDLPTACRCTLWESFGLAKHSTFLPVCMAAKDFPDATRAADAFVRLAALAETNPVPAAAGVRAFWKAQEDRLVAEWPTKLEEWSAGEMDIVSAAVTAYVNFNQVWALAEAKRLYDNLAGHPVGLAQWHRVEFDAYVKELASRQKSPSAFAELLVESASRVFDSVADASSLDIAKTRLRGIIEALWVEVEGRPDTPLPVIAFFAPDFTQGPTSEVPNVLWNVIGPFDRVTLAIDGATVYDGDTGCGEGRWRELCRPGVHCLTLTVGYDKQDVVGKCFYTALAEDEEPVILPRVIEFYADFYRGVEGDAPYVHWSVRDVIATEIWVDKTRVLVTLEETGKFRLTQLKTQGSHVVRIVARNVIDDAESSFVYFTDPRGEATSPSAPSLQVAESAPVINEFFPDAYDAPAWRTPYIHWDLGGDVDSLQLTIDSIPVFLGNGHTGKGRWPDVSGLNIDEMSGVHTVSLSVSNAYGVATSNFTCTCHWEEPPPPPMGSEENPWQVGDDVQAYTNGVGGLVFVGEGATSNFTGAVNVPWAGEIDSIASVTIPDSVTEVGENIWDGMGEAVVINGEAIGRRKTIATGFPAGPAVPDDCLLVSKTALEAAGVGTVAIEDGTAYLGVSVRTNAYLNAATESWGKVKFDAGTEIGLSADGTELIVPVPANAKQGFMTLWSKDRKEN